MKTADEQLAMRQSNILKGEEFVSLARSKGDWERMQLNQAYAFGDYFMSVLLAWRMQKDQAPALATACIAFAERTKRTFQADVPDGEVMAGNFPFEKVNLLIVLNRPRDELESLFCMDYSEFGPIGDRHLMCLLVERLAARPLSASWSDTLAALAKNKRAKLAVETYQTYDSIINAAESGDMDLARLHAKHAAELFLKRAKDKYYEGGPASEGGGPANEFVVDYALAAIQRRYFSSPAPGAEIHWWHWS